jgi:putative transposase
MIHKNEQFKRHALRLKGYDYGQTGVYFVTMVTFRRRSIFGNIKDNCFKLSAIGEIAGNCWLAIPEHFSNTELLTWSIMPNHMHGLIQINNEDYGVERISQVVSNRAQHAEPQRNTRAEPLRNTRPFLSNIIRSYKSAVTRIVNQNKTDFRQPNPVWQRNFYEHIVTSEEELYELGQYIETNLANWEKDKEYIA